MFWRRTNQDFNIRLVDVKNKKNNGLLAGVSLPPSSRVSRVSLAPKTPSPFPFKRLPRRLTFPLHRRLIGRRDCVTSERNVYTVKRKKSAVGEKKNTSPADHRSARFASRYFFLFHPIFCLFPLRTAEPGPRLMIVCNLFLSLLPFKSCFYSPLYALPST